MDPNKEKRPTGIGGVRFSLPIMTLVFACLVVDSCSLDSRLFLPSLDLLCFSFPHSFSLSYILFLHLCVAAFLVLVCLLSSSYLFLDSVLPSLNLFSILCSFFCLFSPSPCLFLLDGLFLSPNHRTLLCASFSAEVTFDIG